MLHLLQLLLDMMVAVIHKNNASELDVCLRIISLGRQLGDPKRKFTASDKKKSERGAPPSARGPPKQNVLVRFSLRPRVTGQ